MARIAIWTASHLPKLGGLEWSTYRLARSLVRLGHEPLFITRTMDGTGPSDVPEVRFAGATVKEWTGISGDWILANRGRFDVLHTIDCFYQAVDEQIGFLSASGLPTVMKIPTQGYIPRLINTPRRKSLFFGIHAFVALNAGIRDELLSVGIGPEKIHNIPNGVDTREFAPTKNKVRVRKILDLPSRDVLVLYMGRFVRRKRLDVLLSAMRSFPPEVKLVLVGSGFGQRDSVEEEVVAQTERASNIILRGPTSSPVAYYQACDVHVLVSEREGLANSVLEGMSCSLPSIVTDIPGLSDVVTSGKEGLVVPVGDAEATAEALDNLRSHPGLRKQFGMNARRKAFLRYEVSKVAAEYETVYRTITKGRGK
ncbi:MAG: glycosyltransferase family 4 protein [Pseudomonadota bacterium]